MARDATRRQTGQRSTASPSGAVRIASRHSVIDRILTEGSPTRNVKDAVIRDLEWLLNTRCSLRAPSEEHEHLENSLYTYGLPDLASFAASSGRTAVLVRAIREAIEKFEPRLKNVSVVEMDDQQPKLFHELRLLITGELQVESTPQQVALETRLELSKGEYRVQGDRP